MSRDAFARYTPNEFNELLEAKMADRRTVWEFQDMIQARICEIIARCAGNKDVKTSDFFLLARDEPDRTPDTPETLESKLKMLTMSLGGTVVNRG